jgi:hypothetical protein
MSFIFFYLLILINPFIGQWGKLFQKIREVGNYIKVMSKPPFGRGIYINHQKILQMKTK